MTLITLIRHGTTEWIEQGRLHGVSDSPLSAKGQREASLAAAALRGRRFDALYTSPLGRARQTAMLIGEAVGLEPQTVDDLRELNFGWMEGGPIFNYADDPPLIRALRSTWVNAVIRLSGETHAHFGERVVAAVREIARRHPDGHALAVIHMGVRGNMLSRLLDNDPASHVHYDGWPACAFTEIELSPTGPARLIQLTVDDHLK
jgi:broad specificity phosphatase PhoE